MTNLAGRDAVTSPRSGSSGWVRRPAAGPSRMVRSSTAVGGLVVLLLALVVLLLPLPLIVLSPGGALPVAERVRFLTTEQDEVSGKLLLTTVELSTATPARALVACFEPQSTVLPREQVIAEGTPSEQYFAAQRELSGRPGRSLPRWGCARLVCRCG